MNVVSTPISIGSMTVANRLVMPPMATGRSEENGAVTPQLCDYYHEKSLDGSLGLIITEHSYVSPEGKAGKGQVSVAEDRCMEGLRRLAATIHHNQTKVIAQINHAGGAANPAVTGYPAMGPSAIALPRKKGDAPLPTAMTGENIEAIIQAFTAAAGRVKQAGFDGVEIHSAHGYLLNQFYSPLTNRRTDRYTGSTLEGRIQLHLDIIRAIRDVVGPDYPLALRLGACDYMEGGSSIEDSVQACQAFERAGVDLLDISGGLYGYTHPTCKQQGYFSEITEKIKQQVSIPVLLTGGITTADAANTLLVEQKADLIGVGRAILQNSHWAKEALQVLS